MSSDQTHSEAKLPAELVVLGDLRSLCEGYASQKPSDQTHSEAKLPAELVVLGDRRSLCEGYASQKPSDQIITGEKIQTLADVYLGEQDDLLFNSFIASQTHKHLLLDMLPEKYDNPPVVFCYTNRLEKLVNKIHFFQNPFVLITHNSDDNILCNESTMRILSFTHLIRWFSQNVAISHEKLVLLPIGLANRQWPHGDIDFFDHFVIPPVKTKHIYFYFNIRTNTTKRMECFQQLCQKIPFSSPMNPNDYKRVLADYQFCICPEGFGYDTHRFWEALYLKVIPIVLESEFIIQLKNTYPTIPMIILTSWDDLHPAMLDYQILYHESDEIFMKHVYSMIFTVQ